MKAQGYLIQFILPSLYKTSILKIISKNVLPFSENDWIGGIDVIVNKIDRSSYE